MEHELLRVEQQGRHRYFRLADPAIAQALELLAVFAPASPVHSLSEADAGRAVRAARMCYNHFAGKFGVALSQALVEKEILTKVDGGYLVTGDGERWLQEVGIECSALPGSWLGETCPAQPGCAPDGRGRTGIPQGAGTVSDR